jgi:hypothetical protein
MDGDFRLYFRQELVQDGRESLNYDIDKGLMTVLLPKAKGGEVFTDLDLLSTLLSGQKHEKKNMIEEVVEENTKKVLLEEKEDQENECVDWEIEPSLPMTEEQVVFFRCCLTVFPLPEHSRIRKQIWI